MSIIHIDQGKKLLMILLINNSFKITFFIRINSLFLNMILLINIHPPKNHIFSKSTLHTIIIINPTIIYHQQQHLHHRHHHHHQHRHLYHLEQKSFVMNVVLVIMMKKNQLLYVYSVIIIFQNHVKLLICILMAMKHTD